MGKKKLVLGATGFVGSAVMRELLKDGNEVKVVLRKSSNTSNIDPYDVERVFADMTDTDSMKKALAGCDTLYITAAYFAHWTPTPKKLYEVNVGGTKATLQAALEMGTEKVVYTSTNNTLARTAHRRWMKTKILINGILTMTIPSRNIWRKWKHINMAQEACRLSL